MVSAHGQKALDTFTFLGVFQLTQAQPLPSPHKQCWMRQEPIKCMTRVSRSFNVVLSGRRENCKKKFEKDALFYEGMTYDGN